MAHLLQLAVIATVMNFIDCCQSGDAYSAAMHHETKRINAGNTGTLQMRLQCSQVRFRRIASSEQQSGGRSFYFKILILES